MKEQTLTRNWELIFAESEYIVLSEIIDLYDEGNIEELGTVLRKYRDKVKQLEERELYWNLVELMEHILLWKFSEKYHTTEHEVKILDYRWEIQQSLEFDGCLTNDTIRALWNEVFEKAKVNAAIYEREVINSPQLTWDEVFNQDY